jgi:hypothetical protein
MGYINSMPGETEEIIEEITYDASCIGTASPRSDSSDIWKGYLVQNLTSFMPNQDDITSIVKYFEESAKKQ